MSVQGRRSKNPMACIKDDLDELPAWSRGLSDAELGESLIEAREAIDRIEAFFADGVRRFDKSGEYAASGALSVTAWLRWKCRLSGSAAVERVEIARQLDKLPKTAAAFARGDLGYQHVAVIARTAEHVGTAAVRKEEGKLLEAAQTMDPGLFVGVAKKFEHRVDAEGALAEANRAYARRYLHVGQPQDGLVRLDGLLDATGGATLQTALNALMKPGKNDERTAEQRRADALVELCRRQLHGGRLPDVAGERPHLIIRTSLETLVGTPGAPAADLQFGAPIPTETVRRHGCDAAITRITGRGELEAEMNHATRVIPKKMRRWLVARDPGCRFPGCDMPVAWTDAHHIKHWIEGGPTTLDNLVLVCEGHHIKVHEDGWRLKREADGKISAIRPPRRIAVHARSA